MELPDAILPKVGVLRTSLEDFCGLAGGPELEACFDSFLPNAGEFGSYAGVAYASSSDDIDPDLGGRLNELIEAGEVVASR